jgi:hypothetical protein
MPCCQFKAKPASDHAAMPCCQPPAQTSCRLTSGCPSAPPQALTSAGPVAPAAGGVITAAAVPDAPPLPANLPAVPPARSGPPFDTPVYLRTLSLLI